MSQENETMTVVYAVREDLEGSKSFGPPKALVSVGEVNTNALGRNLRRVTAQMNELFDEVSAGAGAFELTSFDVAVEITGSGEVRLIGAVSVELSGGISLTFSRRPDPDQISAPPST